MRLVQIGLLATLLAGLGSQAAQAQPGDAGIVTLSDQYGDTNVAGAMAVPGLYDETYIVFRRDVGDGRGYTQGYTSLAGFAPIYKFDYDHLVFTNSRLIFKDDGRLVANVGLGWRRQFHNAILGASAWYDTDESDNNNRFHQYSFGVEMLTETWAVRGNYYNPTSRGDQLLGAALGTTPFFRGNQIIFRDLLVAEAALRSADLEVGTLIPRLPWLGIYAGPYWYEDQNRDSQVGVRGRLVANLSDAATAQIALSNDPVFGTKFTFAISYAIGPKWQPLRPFHRRTLHQRLFQQVARAQRIPIKQFKRRTETPAINPVTGLPYFVLHVDPNGAAGNGTYESPYNAANFANSSQADIIRVLPGNFTNPGTLVLFNNQRLLAANHQHLFIADRGTFVLPGQVAGANPVISNLAGGSVIQLASNNEVSGFDIDGSGTGIGIIGTNIADFNLNRLNITGATDGIRLVNFGQTGLAPPFGHPNTIQDVNVSGSITSGVRLLQNNGGSSAVTIDNLSSTGNGADGLVIDVSASGNFVANVSNSVLSGNGRNAFRAVVSGLATATITASDIVAMQSGEHGVFVSVTDATLNPSTFTRIDASNSGQNMVAGLADGFHLDISNSTAGVSIVDSTAINSGGNMTEENGLRTIADMGSTLVTSISGSNLSGNTVSAINSRVRDVGTVSTLSVANVMGDNSGVDGFLYDVASGSFTASVTGSSFDFSGRNAIRAVGGASPAVMNVTFDSTTADNSTAEGVFFNIVGGGGPSTFNFTYLPTPPSEILNSGGAFGVMATFDGAMTTGAVNFNGITITNGINPVNNVNGASVTVTP